MSGPRRLHPPSAETRARLRDLAERPLSAQEFAARSAIPLGDEERREILDLVRWFRRRYPTPAERLAYARRAYRRWLRTVQPEELRRHEAQRGETSD